MQDLVPMPQYKAPSQRTTTWKKLWITWHMRSQQATTWWKNWLKPIQNLLSNSWQSKKKTAGYSRS
eukprot:13166006-Ditylum_brightwellii.AAC.2